MNNPPFFLYGSNLMLVCQRCDTTLFQRECDVDPRDVVNAMQDHVCKSQDVEAVRHLGLW